MLNYTAVIGIGSSGSSCLALCMDKLGFHMGRNLVGSWGGECQRLGRLCHKFLPFPHTNVLRDPRYRRHCFRRYFHDHCWDACKFGKPAAGKYPALCAFGDELISSVGRGLRIVHIDRPLEDSIRSLQNRSEEDGMATADEAEKYQRFLWEQKHQLLERWPAVATIQHADLMHEPRAVLGALCRIIGRSYDPPQMDAAVALVDPSKTSLKRDATKRQCGQQARQGQRQSSMPAARMLTSPAALHTRAT